MNAQIPVPTLLNLNSLASLGPAEAVALKNDVIKALTDHPFFKDIPLAPLAAAGTNLEESVRLTSARDHSNIPSRNMHLADVIKELTRIGFHVQLQAMEDESQLHTTALPIAERRTRTLKGGRAALTALTGFEAINLDEPGAALLNADSQADAFGYQFQFTKLDPAVEENWIDDAPVPHRGCKKIVIQGLDSLCRYSFRGRAIGDDGAGPWGKPVTIPVT
ncbi:hypothetical protein [Geomesophilobacter sediminis]|uniref:Fibronectin type-III domain-containing protein n=1 Tax=Geomesophilobacter sediminis TaxID=2798584 RepID=A0A8J7JCN9_9BACT|nr:hypothetical protein [Geomesophilobacter sediminis]MBJ6725091.1 hypothetical protein [Geomesophilobacter sediminis]